MTTRTKCDGCPRIAKTFAQFGFHLSAVNPRLAQHYALLPPPDAGPILVPLCGKSVDLAWLAQRGHRVVGVELSELAVRAVFAEQGIAHTIELRVRLAPSCVAVHSVPSPSCHSACLWCTRRRCSRPCVARS